MPALLIALCSLAAGVAVAQGTGDGIVRGPYLQQTQATSTYIVWQTSRPLTGAVHYGRRSTQERTRRAPTRRRLHAVRLDGLSPATTYVYRVTAGGRTTRAFRFTTAKVGAVPFRFGAIGDFGSGAAPEYRNAALLRRESVEFLLTLGDNVYPLGRERGYTPAVFRPFGTLIRRVPIWPTLGNHDYGNEGSRPRGTADAYLRNFVLPARSRARALLLLPLRERGVPGDRQRDDLVRARQPAVPLDRQDPRAVASLLEDPLLPPPRARGVREADGDGRRQAG